MFAHRTICSFFLFTPLPLGCSRSVSPLFGLLPVFKFCGSSVRCDPLTSTKRGGERNGLAALSSLRITLWHPVAQLPNIILYYLVCFLFFGKSLWIAACALLAASSNSSKSTGLSLGCTGIERTSFLRFRQCVRLPCLTSDADRWQT